MAVTKIKPIKSTLSKALDYIQNPDKTDGKMLVSSFGCSYETADIEFGFTLAQAIDKGNNLAHHLIQSFEPGEVDYEKAHEIGKQLADAVTKGQHEYVLTTHIDKGHIHNHIIFCAVNFVDYHKYNSNKRSYYGIRNMSDKLCRENGLSVVVPGKGSKGKSYTYGVYLWAEPLNYLVLSCAMKWFGISVFGTEMGAALIYIVRVIGTVVISVLITNVLRKIRCPIKAY